MLSKNNPIVIYNAKVIGSFFLLAFTAYGFGIQLFESETVSEKFLGSVLIVTNSFMVLFIGILFRKTLQQYSVLVGNIYLFTRVIEAIALASIVLNLIHSISVSHNFVYSIAMLVLGLGSIPMCLTLFRQKLSPSWLAIWGMVGYAVFAFGFLMEFFGKEWSLYLVGLGGLWEITFALWLIIKGGRNKKITNR